MNCKEVIHNEFTDMWLANLQNSQLYPLLRTYKTFKSNYIMEPYLYLLQKPRFRNGIARFRCSSHTLEIERSSHNPKIPVAARVCVHSKVIEDEQHFLLKCDINAFERQCFYVKISWSCHEFIYLNDEEKFLFVLTSVNSQYWTWLGDFSIGLLKKEMHLQYRGRVTHICASKLDHPSLVQIIGLSPVWC